MKTGRFILGLIALTTIIIWVSIPHDDLDEATLLNFLDYQYQRSHGQLPEEGLLDSIFDTHSYFSFDSYCAFESDAATFARCWEPMHGAHEHILIERYPTTQAAQSAFQNRACETWINFNGLRACQSYSEGIQYEHHRLTNIVTWQDQHRIYQVRQEYHSTMPPFGTDMMSLSNMFFEETVAFEFINQR